MEAPLLVRSKVAVQIFFHDRLSFVNIGYIPLNQQYLDTILLQFCVLVWDAFNVSYFLTRPTCGLILFPNSYFPSLPSYLGLICPIFLTLLLLVMFPKFLYVFYLFPTFSISSCVLCTQFRILFYFSITFLQTSVTSSHTFPRTIISFVKPLI